MACHPPHDHDGACEDCTRTDHYVAQPCHCPGCSTSAELDPDEVLAKALWEIDDPEPTYGWDRARANGVYQRMARAAREHVEAERDEWEAQFEQTDTLLSRDEPMGVYRRRDVEALRERAEKAEAEHDAEVRAATLAEFTEWYAPAYTAPNGNTCPIGPETVAREFAESDARDMASPEDETPVYVARRLVGPWEPTDRGD